MATSKIEKPKVFISYAWTSDAYVNKVAEFASSLVRIGIDVLFDKFELKPGNELNNFMERSIKDPTVTNVLILLNKTYQEKADNREGGVGKETQILSEKLYNDVDQTKIIPVVFEKDENGTIFKPVYLGSRFYIDLSNSDTYDSEFRLLVKSLCGETVYRKPELGSIPSWVTEAITFEPKTSVQLSSFSKQANRDLNDQNFIGLLDEIKNNILQYRSDALSNANRNEYYVNYLKCYSELLLFRKEYLELIKNSIFVNSPEKKIAGFFEMICSGVYSLKPPYFTLISVLLHELFIYTIAFFYRMGKYETVAYFLRKKYYSANQLPSLSTFGIFYSGDKHSTLDEAVRARDNKQYHTGVGKYWIENLQSDFCSKEDFVFADILCFNYTQFCEPLDLDMHWFPVTYIYESDGYGKSIWRMFAEKLKTKETLRDAIILFNHKTENGFITRYKQVESDYQKGQLRDWRYPGAWESAPLLCQFTKSEDLGKYD